MRTERRQMPWGDLPRAIQVAPDGIVLIDKPSGVTSHDVVGAVRRLAGTRKVGHAGTLDPMATGLLVVGIGRATKLLTYITGHDKAYETRIAFGATTSSEDADGTVREWHSTEGLTSDAVDTAMAHLTGDILQRPSSVSAIKIDGKRAHELMRDGVDVQIPARPVHVAEFARISELTESTFSDANDEYHIVEMDAVASVSSGTYIRALGRDLGDALGVGAHLRMLRRTRVGAWNVAQAQTIEHLAEYVFAGETIPCLGIDDVCADVFEVIEISEAEAVLLGRGQFIDQRSASSWPAVAVHDGHAIALVSPRGGKLKPDLQIRISPPSAR
ncbi:tRNA pseudouridine(55) synthase TruB [Arcanobacterium canis]